MAGFWSPKGVFNYAGEKVSLLELIARCNGTLIRDDLFRITLTSGRPRVKLFGWRTSLSVRVYCRIEPSTAGFRIHYSAWPGFRTLVSLAIFGGVAVAAAFFSETPVHWAVVFFIIATLMVTCLIAYQDCMRQLRGIFGGIHH